MTTIMDGKQVAEEILKPVRTKVLELKKRGIFPCLAIILVGNNPDSMIYIKQKIKKAKEIGIEIKLFHCQDHFTEDEVKALIDRLNFNSKIHGILLQLPLPSNFDTEAIIQRIMPKKDVDGLTSNSPFSPACAAGIMKILSFYKIDVKNKKVVILGAGRLVGRPVFKLMQQAGAQVVFADIKDLQLIQSADILIGALPCKNVIRPNMVKKGAVVIDASCNVAEGVEKVAGYLTPRIGGVGPTTVAMLLKNVVEAAGIDKK